MNIVLKAVSNPFALLGSLVGSREQLSFVNFEPAAPTSRTERAGSWTLSRKRSSLVPLSNSKSPAPWTPQATVSPWPEPNFTSNSSPQRIKELTLREYDRRRRLIPDRAPRLRGLIHMTYLEVVGIKPVVTTVLPSSTGPTQNFGPGRTFGQGDEPVVELHPSRQGLGRSHAGGRGSKNRGNDRGHARGFRALMHAGRHVQKYLLQTGQVSAERMFIIAPKPIDPSYQGQTGWTVVQ